MDEDQAIEAMRLDRAARRWVQQGPERAPDRLVDAILVAVQTAPQEHRRAWWPELPNPARPLRAAGLAMASMLLLVVSLAVIPSLGSTVGHLLSTSCGGGALVTVAGPVAGSERTATALMLVAPNDVAVAEDGTLFVADGGTGLLWRITPGQEPVEVGGPATTTSTGSTAAPAISSPQRIALDAQGDLYVVDGGTRILKVTPEGVVTAVAGDGVGASTGDDGPASAARVVSRAIATGPTGRIYLADASRYRVIDGAGTIRAFAGSGVPGWSGDGGQATEAAMITTAGIAAAADGRVFLVDQARVRQVDAQGVITTIAGTGSAGSPIEGAPAIESPLLAPGAMTLGPDGSLYVVDGNAVLRIDASGALHTVAGSSSRGQGVDCGPAIGATLDRPTGVAFHDGALYIADTGNARVVKVRP